MTKISCVGIPARNKAIKGMSYVGSFVLQTIGPNGLNALLEKGRKITNDGYSISAEMCNTLEDEYERLGALVAHEASAKTNDMVGDATSTAWALTEAITKEAVRYLPTEKTIKAKKNVAEVTKMIQESKEYVISELEKSKKPIESKEELIKSALVSVEDEKLADLIGSMQWELGPEGIIIAEEVNEKESSIEKVTGIRIDNGFSATHLVTDPEKGTLEVKECPIFLTNYTIGIEELGKLKEIFQQLVARKKLGIIIIARAFTADAIKACQDSAQAGFPIFPINAPYTDQKEVMRDIQAVVGGRYIDTEEASLDDLYITDIGYVKKLVARAWDATIAGVDDEHSKKRVKARAEELQKKITGSGSDFEKRLLEQRMAQLTNGFAILKVGSHSVTDRKRLKDKADDATNAVRHALKGGTVKGGGLAFKEVSDTMDDENILKRPLTCIYDQIILSAPDNYEIPEWCRDPFIVLKTALENACSFVPTFISINGIVTSSNPKECKCNDSNQELT
jgi:chaperonin GroEL